MIEINPNALYTRADLAGMLEPAGVDVDYFISRIRPRRFLRMVYYGKDILHAMDRAPTLEEQQEARAPADFPTPHTYKKRRTAADSPGNKLRNAF